jgi:steroid 5-alpha reductase family enzyme
MRQKIRASRGLGILVSVTAYVIALLAALLVAREADLGHPLADLALGNLVATVVVFAFSVLADNSSVYDPYWSIQPLAIAGYYLWADWDHLGARQIIITVLVALYCLRLTSNFYRDWPGLRKEDFRYVSFRERFGMAYWPMSFLGIHLFPTIMVFLGCLPLYAVTHSEASGLGWLDALGILVTLGAVLLALVADEQLRRFRRDPCNRGSVVAGGLWSLSRHPNYLGEVTTWWGLWFFALAAGAKWWWTVGGAVAITAMFVLVSIPWMERRMLSTRAEYAEYQAKTPMLVPRLSR